MISLTFLSFYDVLSSLPLSCCHSLSVSSFSPTIMFCFSMALHFINTTQHNILPPIVSPHTLTIFPTMTFSFLSFPLPVCFSPTLCLSVYLRWGHLTERLLMDSWTVLSLAIPNSAGEQTRHGALTHAPALPPPRLGSSRLSSPNPFPKSLRIFNTENVKEEKMESMRKKRGRED